MITYICLGVMILPEFDAPAHVGAGWESQNSSFTVCVDWEPWYEKCVQPGCGQVGIEKNKLKGGSTQI